MNIVNWTPFRDMEGFFDRYYNALGRSPMAGNDAEMRRKLQWRPSVSVENGILTISGERHYETEEETETKHRIESMYGRFSRSFTLPSDADEAKISAKSKNGVLKVRIPKMEAVQENKVRVSVE